MKHTDLPRLDQAKLLIELMAMPGWALLGEIIEDGAIATAKRELEENEHKNLEEVKFLQYKISVCREMLSLPQQFVDDLKEELAKEQLAKEQPNQEDPYPETIEEIDRRTQEEIENVDNPNNL